MTSVLSAHFKKNTVPQTIKHYTASKKTNRTQRIWFPQLRAKFVIYILQIIICSMLFILHFSKYYVIFTTKEEPSIIIHLLTLKLCRMCTNIIPLWTELMVKNKSVMVLTLTQLQPKWSMRKIWQQGSCMLSHFSCDWRFVTPWTVAHQALLSMGFARQEYCSGMPCAPLGHFPTPGIKPRSPALQAG